MKLPIVLITDNQYTINRWHEQCPSIIIIRKNIDYLDSQLLRYIKSVSKQPLNLIITGFTNLPNKNFKKEFRKLKRQIHKNTNDLDSITYIDGQNSIRIINLDHPCLTEPQFDERQNINNRWYSIWKDIKCLEPNIYQTARNVEQIYFDDYGKRTSFFDIVFLSYQEPYAEQHWQQLTHRFGSKHRCHRIDGIDGIKEAHIAAARTVRTPLFFVVDADAKIKEDFWFNKVPTHKINKVLYTWQSINPVNGLRYGYGGVKLFSRDCFDPDHIKSTVDDSYIDFSTTIAKHFIPIQEVSNETAFNYNPYTTWKAAFRECTKLYSGCIKNHNHDESKERLDAWINSHDGAYAEYARRGAQSGISFAHNHPNQLHKINDYEWLEQQFNLIDLDTTHETENA